MFNVDFNLVFSYFSDNEFYPHVDDLLNNLKKVKDKFYKNNHELFIQTVKDFLRVKHLDELQRTHSF
jgi:hypothetical protein